MFWQMCSKTSAPVTAEITLIALCHRDAVQRQTETLGLVYFAGYKQMCVNPMYGAFTQEIWFL